MQSRGWRWKEIKELRWEIPSEEAYHLAHRWKSLNKLRFLDLGCGIGRHAIFFAKQGFEVFAYDISESGISTLKEKVKKENLNIKIDLGDMLSLPYPSESFDCILAYHVIYHTDRKGLDKVISEIKRVLVKDGEIFVTFNSKESPSYKNPQHKRINGNTILKQEGKEAGILHYYVDEEEVLELMKDFDIISLRYIKEIKPYEGCKYYVLARKV